MDCFSDVIPRICVPLFFVISGLLFFKDGFSRMIYKRKVSTRKRTLILPYLIWNFFGFLLILVYVHPVFRDLETSYHNWHINIETFFDSFWVLNNPNTTKPSTSPANFPLWFLRDLIIMVLASPIIYKLIKIFGIFFIVFFGLLWFWGWDNGAGFPIRSYQSLFFFPLGAYLGIKKFRIYEVLTKNIWFLYVYGIMLFADLISRGAPYNFIFHKLMILFGIAAIAQIAIYYVRNGYSIPAVYEKASFFIFLLHGLFIQKFAKIMSITLNPQTELTQVMLYFFVPILTIIISIGLFRTMNYIMPTFLLKITGR